VTLPARPDGARGTDDQSLPGSESSPSKPWWIAGCRRAPFGVWEALSALNALVLIAKANLRFMIPRAAMLQHWDEAYALAFARRMLEGQNLPYVDAVSQRGPLFYWLVALAVKIFGFGTWMPVRALMIVFMPLTAICGFLAACFARRSLAGAVMALVYFTLCLRTYGEGAAGYGFACNSEHFANAFSMAALLALTVTLRSPKATPSLAGLGLAGALIMLSGLCKQVGLVVSLPMGLWVLAEAIDRRHLPMRTRRWMAGAFALGFLAPFALLLARYAIAGELFTLYYYTVAYNFEIYVPAVPALARAKFWQELIEWYPETLLVLVSLSSVSVALLFARANLSRGARMGRELLRLYAKNGFDIVAGSSVLLTLLSASMVLRMWGHYYVQVFPWAALAGGVVLDRASGLGPLTRNPRRTFLIHAAVLVPLLLMTNLGWALRSKEYNYSSEVREAFETRDWPVCRFLHEKTKPSDSIFIWGFAPVPYVACNRRAASRYVFTIYPAGVVPWVIAPRETEEARVVPGSREILLADLRKDMPAAILDEKDSMMGRSMMDYEFMRTFVTTNYCEYEDHAHGVHAWLRKPEGGCAQAPSEDTAPETRVLKLYWSKRSPPLPGDLEARAPHRDSLTVASAEGIRDAELRGFEEEPPAFGSEPGAVFIKRRPGTIPLRVLYDRRHSDSITTATYDTPFLQGSDRIQAGRAIAGRVEGYIYAAEQPDTWPLNVYYETRSHDHLTTARPEVAQAALEAGYVFQRTEGFVPRH
jgi:hypothetical protein